MKEWCRKYKTEILLFCLGFGIRFLYAVFVQASFGADGFLAYSDAFSFYLRGAENVIAHHTFSLHAEGPFLPDAYRPPLYTLFVAAFLWAKLPLFSIIFVQNIMGGLISVLSYRISLRCFDAQKLGIIVAVFLALEPMSVYWNNLLMSDTLFALLFLFAFHEFASKRYYSFALLFGLATLTRSVGLYLFPVFLAALWWQYRQSTATSAGVPWKRIILSALLFFAVLSPWMIRNKVVFGTFQLSSASWYNLYPNVMGQFAQAKGFMLPLPDIPDTGNPEDYALALYEFAHVPFYKEHFKRIFFEQPVEYVIFHNFLILRSFLKNPYGYLSEYVIAKKLPSLGEGIPGALLRFAAVCGGLMLYALYVLAAAAVFDRRYRLWFSLVLILLLLTLASLGALGLGADMSRYMLPFMPFFLLFAGVGLQALSHFSRHAFSK